mgnify:CR=1 FL=1
MQALTFLPLAAPTRLALPLYLSPVAAGFPSPAEDYIDRKLDLNEQLIRNPASTFFVRVDGDSMRDASIASGDILVVDRSLAPRNNAIAIAAINGELTVKRLKKVLSRLWLVPENPEFPPIEIVPEMQFEIWGVVTYIIHKAV